VSAAAGARLAVVADAPAAATPLDRLVRTSALQSRRTARALWGVQTVWIAGCVSLIVGALLLPVSDWALAAMLLVTVFVLPASGLAIVCFALVDRSREAVRALAGTTVLFAVTLGLVQPARRAGIELHFAAHQAELDRLAAGLAAAPASRVVDRVIPSEVLGQDVSSPRLRRLGFVSAGRVDGGVIFRGAAGDSYLLFRADGDTEPPAQCRARPARFLGGRWFQVWCGDEELDD
jgi:hypothetical protein